MAPFGGGTVCRTPDGALSVGAVLLMTALVAAIGTSARTFRPGHGENAAASGGLLPVNGYDRKAIRNERSNR